MKTQITLIVIFFMLGFGTCTLNAQPVQHGEETNFICIEQNNTYYPCLPEDICGYVTYSWISNGKIFTQNFGGMFEGRNSGSVYRIKDTQSSKVISNKGQSSSWSKTVLVHCDGKPVAKLSFSVHTTVNANGETTAQHFDDWVWECF